jgi:hypothetical protein
LDTIALLTGTNLVASFIVKAEDFPVGEVVDMGFGRRRSEKEVPAGEAENKDEDAGIR